ncbi:MAG: hypothetical protein E6Q73_08445 [Pseudorhodobacter sp.]|nr:MAG: hypothetical protein E6Q73_08445 [Pseudorhodobacter sp.]
MEIDTLPVFTPSTGQTVGRIDPSITNCRPVSVLNLPTTSPAIFSAGIRNKAPTARTASNINAKTDRTIHRIANPSSNPLR